MSLAAVKKFGLLVDEGRSEERRGRLTDLAVDIISNPDPVIRTRGIKHAALLPSIHRELWNKYRDNLPTDANLRWELVRHRGFMESGAEDFIREYKQTVAFAELRADDGEAVLRHLRSVGESEPEFLAELIELFVADTATQLQALEQAVAVGDLAAIARTAHELEGACGYLGADQMQTLCARLERLGGDTALAEAASLVPLLKIHFERACAVLTRAPRSEPK